MEFRRVVMLGYIPQHNEMVPYFKLDDGRWVNVAEFMEKWEVIPLDEHSS
jgi:hypothetical protein